MANYYGIDFGTTNSAVYSIAEINGEISEEFPIGEDDRQPLPSFVAINKHTGEVVTGKTAKDTLILDEDYEIFSSIKSVIDSEKEWEFAGKTWSPVDIAAELFKSLKAKAESRTHVAMEEAVVAVPVGFDSKKKYNVRKAAYEAGIKVTMFVSEPTAAFVSRKPDMKKFHNVAVFDWGGGTLDVVVLRVENNIVNEMAAGGIKLAGNDIDRILAERVVLNAAEKLGKDFSFEDLPRTVQLRILQKCEQAKCALAADDTVNIADAKLGDFGRMYEKVNYDFFSLLIENEIDQAVKCLLKVLSEAGMNEESIDCILCVGGSSRLRPLQRKLLKYFDRDKLIFPRKAMWDIATGVAQISYKPGCYTLNRPIGIVQSNNQFYELLKVGQRIPTEEKTVKFGLVETTDEARLILSDGDDADNQTFFEYFPVKLRGMTGELLEVSCYVDADMVFRMKVHSSYAPADVFRVWTYSNLKVSYELDAPDPNVRGDEND